MKKLCPMKNYMKLKSRPTELDLKSINKTMIISMPAKTDENTLIYKDRQ